MTSCSIDYKAAVWDLRRTGDMGGVLRGPGEWSHLIVLPYGKDAQNCLDFLVIVLCMCPISYSAFLNLQMTRLEGETLEGTSFLLSLVLNRWAVFLSQILFSPFFIGYVWHYSHFALFWLFAAMLWHYAHPESSRTSRPRPSDLKYIDATHSNIYHAKTPKN